LVKNAKLPKPNITKDERPAIHDLNQDPSIMILPADKGKATLVLNTVDYKTKMDLLLADNNTYLKLNKEPTTKYKTKLINILKEWKNEKCIPDHLYWRLYLEPVPISLLGAVAS